MNDRIKREKRFVHTKGAGPPLRPLRPMLPIPVSRRYPARRKKTDGFGGIECANATLKYKWYILCVILIAGISPFLGTRITGHLFVAEATIAPRSGLQETDQGYFNLLGSRRLRRQMQKMNQTDEDYAYLKIGIVTRSVRFGQYIYDKYGQELIPLVFFRNWDLDKNGWRWGSKIPSRQMIVRRLGLFAHVRGDKQSEVIYVRSMHPDPETAKYLVDLYLEVLSEFLRNDTIAEARSLQRFLVDTARKTSDVLLKKKLYEMLDQAQSKELFAYAHTPYGFKVFDPAVVPDKDKYIRPKYFRNCVTRIAGALLLALGAAIAIEFIRYAKPYVINKDLPISFFFFSPQRRRGRKK